MALVLYALLPVLRNTLVGILGVDPAVRESAVAMGLTSRQLLRMVELPLAARTILAGAVPAGALALLADGLLSVLERRVTNFEVM